MPKVVQKQPPAKSKQIKQNPPPKPAVVKGKRNPPPKPEAAKGKQNPPPKPEAAKGKQNPPPKPAEKPNPGAKPNLAAKPNTAAKLKSKNIGNKEAAKPGVLKEPAGKLPANQNEPDKAAYIKHQDDTDHLKEVEKAVDTESNAESEIEEKGERKGRKGRGRGMKKNKRNKRQKKHKAK